MHLTMRECTGYILLLLLGTRLPLLVSFISPSRQHSHRKSRTISIKDSYMDRYYDPVFWETKKPSYPVDEHTIYLTQYTHLKTLASQDRIKVYVLSDLHADAEKNHQWVLTNCMKPDQDIQENTYSILILPGDIGSEVDRITSIIKALVASYDAVCYITGNHEAWRRGTARGKSTSATTPELRTLTENRMSSDSVAKISEICQVVRQNGAYIGPIRVSLHSDNDDGDGSDSEETRGTAVNIVPLQSWYHSSWDREPDLTSPLYKEVEAAMPMARKWGDFSMCKWPESMINHSDFASTDITNKNNEVLSEAFASLNEPFLTPVDQMTKLRVTHKEEGRAARAARAARADSGEAPCGSPHIEPGDGVISFSHFLPRVELCPEKRFLREPLLTRVVGSDILESQIRRLSSHLHLFGHTHIPIDLELEGVRYVQWPLGYSREGKYQCAPVRGIGPICVYDTSLGKGGMGICSGMASLNVAWTEYYRKYERRPDIVGPLAPWLVSRLEMSGWGRGEVERPSRAEDIVKISR